MESVLTCQVIPPRDCAPHTLLEDLRLLEEEDPALQVRWSSERQEIYVNLMGEVQTQVLQRQIKDRFGLVVTFGPGSILYRETIASTVEGVGHFEPLRHYAEVHVLLEPLPAGSGVEVALDCPTDMLDVNWQRQIYGWLSGTEHIGVLTGSPVTDLRLTLVAGRAHPKHTEGGDFRQAALRAVRQGLMKAKSVLLEPWQSFVLEVPQECVGRAMTDISRMEGEVAPPENRGARRPGCGERFRPPVWETTPRRLPDIREEREDFPWNWRAIFSAITPGKSSKPSDMTARGIPAIRPDPYSAVTVPGMWSPGMRWRKRCMSR